MQYGYFPLHKIMKANWIRSEMLLKTLTRVDMELFVIEEQHYYVQILVFILFIIKTFVFKYLLLK